MTNLTVFTTTGPAQKTAADGCISKTSVVDGRLMPIGVLIGYEGDETEILEKASKELSEVGEVSFVAIPTEDDAGYLGIAYAPGLIVKSYTAAKALDGFMPFFDHSGFYFPLPEITGALNAGDVAFRQEFKGRPPRYENGAAVFSMVPLGMLGWQVYFEDEPGHVYYVAFNVAYSSEGLSNAAVLAAADEFRKAHA